MMSRRLAEKVSLTTVFSFTHITQRLITATVMTSGQRKKVGIAVCVVIFCVVLIAVAAAIKGNGKVEKKSVQDTSTATDDSTSETKNMHDTSAATDDSTEETKNMQDSSAAHVDKTESTTANDDVLQPYRDFSLVLTYIDKGLGDFYWTLNIYRAVLDARKGSPACVVAYLKEDANIDSVRREHRYLVFRDADSIHDVVLEHNVFFVLRGESADRAGFDRINALAKAVSLCICFDTCSRFYRYVEATKVFEYDYAHTAILFQDYSAIPLENEYRKTRLTPEKYRRTLAEDKQAMFDAARIASLVPDTEYVFCYFCTEPFYLPEAVMNLLALVSDVMSLDGSSVETVTVLANFELTKMLEWDAVHDVDMEKRKERVRRRMYPADVDFDRGTVRVRGWPEFRFVSYGHATEPEFEYMLLRSGEVAGCTGDMSLSQVLSTGRIIAYQCLSHKEGFFTRLEEIWREVNKNDYLRMLSDKTSSYLRVHRVLPENFDMQLFREQYRVFLAHLRRNDFRAALQRIVRETTH